MILALILRLTNGYWGGTQTNYESWYTGWTGANRDIQFDVAYYGSLGNSTGNSMFIDSYFNSIITYVNYGTTVSALSDVWINGNDWKDSLNSRYNDSFAIHQQIYSGNDIINAGGVQPNSVGVGNRLGGYNGADNITGGHGHDYIHGMNGADYILGGAGNDEIRGGYGHDLIDGMTGSDWIWGGLGWNVLGGGSDTVQDQIYVPADSVRNSKGNPGGVLADIIYGVDTNDLLYIYGVSDSSLTYVDNVTHPLAGQFVPTAPGIEPNNYTGVSYTGVGVYSNGVLEAIVVVDGATSSLVDQFTTGIL